MQKKIISKKKVGIRMVKLPDLASGRDFLFWARSNNPENPEIPGIGIGIWKSWIYPQKIPKFRGLGIFWVAGFFSLDGISRQKATSDYKHEILVKAWGFWNFKNFGKYTCGGKDQRWDDYLFQSRNLQQSALQHRNRYLVFRFCLMSIHRI